MKYTHTIYKALLFHAGSFCLLLASPLAVLSATFTGDDLNRSLQEAEAIRIGGNSDLRATAIAIIQAVLSFLGIIAVFVIVIAGIMLVVGGGSDESRQKTIKIIIYTLVGLIVILLASAFVAFVIDVGTGVRL